MTEQLLSMESNHSVPVTADYNLTTIMTTSNSVVTDAPQKYYYGAETLEVFMNGYKPYHGFIAAAVCVFGIVANILNIIVLTRRNMISATNCILTGLAVSDGLTMVAYLPYALRFYVLYGTEPTPERNTLDAIRFMLFFACFSVVVHTVSIWLTVTLAVFRYIFIKYPRRGALLCSLSRAKLAVFLVYLVTLLVCIPNFVTISVQGHPKEMANGTIIIWIVNFKLETPVDRFLTNFNFWIQATLVKLVPCVGLTILSILLVRTMKKAESRRRNLQKASARAGEDDSGRDRKTNRTTRMLLAVVILFLITEFPQGVLNALSGFLPHFQEEIYNPLGDFVDILALINNGINFILYCTMSKQFRDTFVDLFLTPKMRDHRRFSLVPTTAHGTCTRTEKTEI
jgi:G protein-coupled receptor 139